VSKIVFFFFIFISHSLFAYEILPVDSVKAGMKGYGISVFGANRLDTFNVEILGVLEKAGPGMKLIIARLNGAGLEKTGIISGMSGSPVFINEKIIGAVAYAWSFAIEPITGITPIEEIIAAKIDTIGEGEGQSEIKIRGEGKMSPYSGVTLTRIRTPLSVSGFDDWLIKKIDNFFGAKGFNIVMGGGTSGERSESDSLFIGSAVAARLVGGDASLAAIGTVTYVDGKDVFAFGHPLFFSGTTSIPMTTAYIYAIMPSQLRSFKISSTEKEVGAVLQDRRGAIYGVIGEKARTIPLNVTVKKRKSSKTFHFDIVDHKELTSFFTGLTFSNSVLTQGRSYGSLTLSLDVNLKLEKYGDVQIKNFFSGENALMSSMNNINDVLKLILKDNFEKIKIEEISLTTDVSEEIKTAEIETVKPGSFSVRRGEKVNITVFLKGMKGKVEKEKFAIRVPETYNDSTIKIAVVGANGLTSLELERATDRFKVEREGQIIELLKLIPRNNVLYCLLLSTKMGMIMRGYELGSLPSSMLHLMQGSQNLGEGRFTKGGIVARMEKECDFVVSGSNTITLKIID